MTTYTAITNAQIDADSPIDVALMTQIRDNPIAITEGSTGAPNIQRAAFDTTVLHKWLYDYGDESDGAQAWTGTTTKAPGMYQCTTFDVAASAVITLANPGPLIILATTSIIINATGSLSVNGGGGQGQAGRVGQRGTWGGSGGGALTTSDGGATYLTDGGAQPSGVGAAQSAQTKSLLLATAPLVPMSPQDNASAVGGDYSHGGGAGGGETPTGGDGGGLIILCAPIVTIAGTCTANGTNGGSGGGGGGGGGGGAIVIATPSGGYTGTGTITANAGNGAGGGGNGGAGFVKTVTI